MSCVPVVSNVFRKKKIFKYSFLSELFQNLLISPVHFTICILEKGEKKKVSILKFKITFKKNT